jgi:hypothetical protein
MSAFVCTDKQYWFIENSYGFGSSIAEGLLDKTYEPRDEIETIH